MKFEQFIFDALPQAERWAIVETDRATEFEPLKNAVGPDSPATVHQRMSDLFGNWLEQAGATVPRRADGSIPFGIEISPLFALDAQELKTKLEPGLVVERPIYLRDAIPNVQRGLWQHRGQSSHKDVSCCTPSSWPEEAAPGSGPRAGATGPSNCCNLYGDATMLQQTVARIEPLVPDGAHRDRHRRRPGRGHARAAPRVAPGQHRRRALSARHGALRRAWPPGSCRSGTPAGR